MRRIWRIQELHGVAGHLALASVVFLLILTGFVVAACGGGDAQGSDAGQWTNASPKAFPDEFSAKLASDGEQLWIAVLGEPFANAKTLQAKVFVRAGGHWKAATALRRGISGSSPISLAIPAESVASETGSPCIGFTTTSGETDVRCHVDGSWAPTRLPREMQQSGQIVDLQAYAGGLVALSQASGPHELVLRAWSLSTNGWHPIGAPIVNRSGGVGLLGQNSDLAAVPDIFVTSFGRTPAREVWSLQNDQWVQSVPALKGPGMGPSTSGSVREGEQVYVPVNVASGNNWPLSIYGFTPQHNWHKIAGREVNVGLGSSQGQIDYAGGHTWVTWQQNDPVRLIRGLFPTKIFAQCLSQTGFGARTLLWKGLSIGPGSVQVVRAGGQDLALFMRADPENPRGLEATVRPVDC